MGSENGWRERKYRTVIGLEEKERVKGRGRVKGEERRKKESKVGLCQPRVRQRVCERERRSGLIE